MSKRIKPKPRADYIEDDEDDSDDYDHWDEYAEDDEVVAAICRSRGKGEANPNNLVADRGPAEIWNLCRSKKEVLAASDADVIWASSIDTLALELRKRHSKDASLDYVITQGEQARVLTDPIWKGPLNTKQVEKFLKEKKCNLYVPRSGENYYGTDSRWNKFLKKLQDTSVGEVYEPKYTRENGYHFLARDKTAGARRRETAKNEAEYKKQQKQREIRYKKANAKRTTTIKIGEFMKLGTALHAALKQAVPKPSKQQLLAQVIKSISWLDQRRPPRNHSKATVIEGVLFIYSLLSLLGDPHRKQPSAALKKQISFLLPHAKGLKQKNAPFCKLGIYIAAEAKALKIS